MKYKLILLCIYCCFIINVNAQEKADKQKNKTVLQQDSIPKWVLNLKEKDRTWVCHMLFLKDGKVMKVNESTVEEGTTIIVEVGWDPRRVKEIIYDCYKPTAEEIKNCKYTFVIKPNRTTTYTGVYYLNGVERPHSRTITVVPKKSTS